MKKLFATLACTALLSVSITTASWAQDQPAQAPEAAATEEVAAPAVADQEETQEAALCMERIIYLNLSDTNVDKLLKGIEDALARGDVEGAKKIARETRGPVASIAYQGLMRMDQGIDIVERSITSYGGVQGGLLEKNLSWITLFIAMAPSLGFLGTVVGMVMAFDKIEKVGDISPTVVAGGMKVALITTIFGLIVALILQLFYNYILSKVEAILNKMEDASISLLDLVIKYNIKK